MSLPSIAVAVTAAVGEAVMYGDGDGGLRSALRVIT
jgi:hypothetical protein